MSSASDRGRWGGRNVGKGGKDTVADFSGLHSLPDCDNALSHAQRDLVVVKNTVKLAFVSEGRTDGGTSAA